MAKAKAKKKEPKEKVCAGGKCDEEPTWIWEEHATESLYCDSHFRDALETLVDSDSDTEISLTETGDDNFRRCIIT